MLNQHKADTAQVPAFFCFEKRRKAGIEGVSPNRHAVRHPWPLSNGVLAIRRSVRGNALTAGSTPYRAALALQGVFEVSFVSNQQYAAPAAKHDINLLATTAQHE
ncbi:hypothetical protein [Brumicola pallidula]|uniref:Uncharacterized protein n=1 Tax=Brumicola pallidula DSM 14239 = ACAM 615 TaxID=1121922 RepID=K6YDT2_9ALTE|nr:hypothetical protein [Glaciecola pallidula]GAC30899.1 hypothetical protein GPAL_4060 [Glaciecola pallidula DSM 14239 = ACAM 615]